MANTLVLLERPRGENVALLRLNRPERRNALSNALMRELADALETLDHDDLTRAVVICGDERAFAAGADIEELITPGPDFAQWDRLWRVGIPIIAAIRGLALGGGLELAMSCDLVVAAEDARLGQPEVKLGLIPGAGGTQRLTHALGKTLAMEIVLLGRELSGREAYQRGLVNACVSEERTIETALDMASQLAKCAPVAVRTAKKVILGAFNEGLGASLRNERREFHALLQTQDAREGIAAFTERREPKWQSR